MAYDIYVPLSPDFFIAPYPHTWTEKLYVTNGRGDEPPSAGFREFTGPGGHRAGEYGYKIYRIDKDAKIAELEKELAEFRAQEKELSESYVRIRGLVGTFDAGEAGKHRFEYTEAAVKAFVEASGRPHAGLFITIEQLELAHMKAIIAKTSTLDEAARILGIDIATLYRKRKRHGFPMGPTPERA